MKIRAALIAGVSAAVLAGCVDMQSTVRLKPNGSGTLTMEQYFSPQMTSMMGSMAGMAEAMGGTTGETNAPAAQPDPLAMFSDTIEQQIKSLGSSVKLEKKESATNAAGWKGFKLICSFEDINKVNLHNVGASDASGEGEESEEKPMSITFTPGKPAKLVIIEPETPAVAAEPEAAPEGMDPQAMMQMMAPMMAGMRMRMVIEVDGKIVKTNAKYVEGNRVTLADVSMDKVMANAEGGKLIASAQNDPAAMTKLAALNIEGVKINTEKTLEIEFE
ncbi:MAG: hypothetical protein KBA51_04370 [Kiritimatiellae bacterium]|nr:hypothetical protein [Kiritimatiellia bacterium]